MQREGYAQTVGAVAYSWFNRFAALRYMELHDYLGHGHRALSNRQGGLPEILARASELARAADLPALKEAQINELKLAGTLEPFSAAARCAGRIPDVARHHQAAHHLRSPAHGAGGQP